MILGDLWLFVLNSMRSLSPITRRRRLRLEKIRAGSNCEKLMLGCGSGSSFTQSLHISWRLHDILHDNNVEEDATRSVLPLYISWVIA